VTTVVSRLCTAATAMAATTAVLMICVLPPALEARRPYVKRSGRPRRREAFVYAADNRTRPAAAAAEPLFRFALVGDSPAVLQVVLGQLSEFARGGGQFAVHTGDSVCAGSSFELSRTEHGPTLIRRPDTARVAARRCHRTDWPG